MVEKLDLACPINGTFSPYILLKALPKATAETSACNCHCDYSVCVHSVESQHLSPYDSIGVSDNKACWYHPGEIEPDFECFGHGTLLLSDLEEGVTNW